MRKLFLWLLLLAGMSHSVPSVRSRVEPHLAPLRDHLVREAGPAYRQALTPVYRWLAAQEMRSIAIQLRRRGLELQPLPQPREFARFLEQQRYIQRGSLDPWGTPYTLTLMRDSIVVGSAGPDGIRGTEDDLLHAEARR